MQSRARDTVTSKFAYKCLRDYWTTGVRIPTHFQQKGKGKR